MLSEFLYGILSKENVVEKIEKLEIYHANQEGKFSSLIISQLESQIVQKWLQNVLFVAFNNFQENMPPKLLKKLPSNFLYLLKKKFIQCLIMFKELSVYT